MHARLQHAPWLLHNIKEPISCNGWRVDMFTFIWPLVINAEPFAQFDTTELYSIASW